MFKFSLALLLTFLTVAPPASADTSALLTEWRKLDPSATCAMDGASCQGKLPSYSSTQPVVIFVPSQYRSTFGLDLIIHFHGHLNRTTDSSPAGVLQEFQFGQKLAASRRNAILVMPASQGRCNDYKAAFVSRDGYPAFIAELTGLLKRSGLANTAPSVTLMGHSGAYVPIASILKADPNRARAVVLYDATYGEATTYTSYSKAGKRLIIYYLKDSDTQEVALKIAADGRFSRYLELQDRASWSVCLQPITYQCGFHCAFGCMGCRRAQPDVRGL